LRVALAPAWTAFRGEDRLTRAPVTRMEVLPLASSYNQALRPIRTLSPVLDHLGDTFVLAVADSPGNQAVHRGMLFELVAAIEAAWTTLEAPPAAMLEAVANPGRS
jgi:hypothetical protein